MDVKNAEVLVRSRTKNSQESLLKLGYCKPMLWIDILISSLSVSQFVTNLVHSDLVTWANICLGVITAQSVAVINTLNWGAPYGRVLVTLFSVQSLKTAVRSQLKIHNYNFMLHDPMYNMNIAKYTQASANHGLSTYTRPDSSIATL